MPGIVGLITRMPGQEAKLQLQQMVAALCHEPFYETGIWIDESIGVYIGWTARENSFAAGMPLTNERGDVVLVFSGEEYPEPGVAYRLSWGSDLTATWGDSPITQTANADGSFQFDDARHCIAEMAGTSAH